MTLRGLGFPICTYVVLTNETCKPFRNGSMNLFFLDSYIYKQRKETVAMRRIGLPTEYLALVENEMQAQLVIESYFNGFHPYFACSEYYRYRERLH